MPIAMHPPIGHNLFYQPMRGNWHRLANMVTKRHLPRAAMWAAGCHPLSLVDKIKIISFIILFILTRDQTMLLNYIRFGSFTILEAASIRVMAFSTWSSNVWSSMMRYVVTSPLHTQTWGIGIPLTLPPFVPLLHPLFLPTCLLRPIIPALPHG